MNRGDRVTYRSSQNETWPASVDRVHLDEKHLDISIHTGLDSRFPLTRIKFCDGPDDHCCVLSPP